MWLYLSFMRFYNIKEPTLFAICYGFVRAALEIQKLEITADRLFTVELQADSINRTDRFPSVTLDLTL